MSDLEVRVKKVVAEQLNVEEGDITLESNFIDDLGADSLDTVELVMAFEQEFGIDISDNDSDKIKTVGEALDFIKSKTKGE